ncbi:MAG: hypothetical protein HRU00_10125 [Myxococcales bacterium]|nr:hypothetical protein [Myxococcales bacterium]
MSIKATRLVASLIERFGVPESFAQGLSPLLNHCDLSELDSAGRDQLLGALAALYRGVEDSGRPTAELGQDAVVLVDELRSELRKMDESLKVLGAFVAKLRKQIEPLEKQRLIH